ncbi:hypothetical protein PFISCL1PPCAC_2472, partial [Pristionchus fissidentatus]
CAVVQESGTFIVKNSTAGFEILPGLDYYWGLENLPNVKDRARCQRRIWEIELLRTFKFYPKNNTMRFLRLAWSCPESTKCCQWECCRSVIVEDNSSGYIGFGFLFLPIGAIIYVIRS